MKKAPRQYTISKAFTMLEFVFVIVIIGILAAVIVPSTRTNPLQEAAVQLVSHIRYTQHLAMVDDKFDVTNPDWYKERWQLIFQIDEDGTENQVAYTIFSDKVSTTGTAHDAKPNTTNGEIARDPSNNSKYLSGGTQSLNTRSSEANIKMNLGLSYGIDSYEMDGGCSGYYSTRISFDNFGRPIANSLVSYTAAYKSDSYKRLINETCIIRLIDSSEGSIEIHIEPETGYAHIVYI